MSVLDVRDLKVAFNTPDGVVEAVNGVSFSLEAGKCLGVVGESGSGKTQTFMAIMGVVPDNATVTGCAMFDGRDLLSLPTKEMNKIRGARMAFVMQDALSALTPHMRIGKQLSEVLRIHKGMSAKDADRKVLDVLDQVRIPEASRRMAMYPHELSGGMRQRVTIGMALLCDPDILIADEPTTALDVTIQAQVLDLFDELRRNTDTAIVLITHDLGVLAGRADDVMVMYGGRVAERADVNTFFDAPMHPYSIGLLDAIPRIESPVDQALTVIPGRPPDLSALPAGCAYAPRCPKKIDICDTDLPVLTTYDGDHLTACHVCEAS